MALVLATSALILMYCATMDLIDAFITTTEDSPTVNITVTDAAVAATPKLTFAVVPSCSRRQHQSAEWV